MKTLLMVALFAIVAASAVVIDRRAQAVVAVIADEDPQRLTVASAELR